MNIIYNNAKVKGYCTNMKKAQKAFNSQVALKLHAAVNQIEAAPSIRDVVNFPPYHFHLLKGDRKGYYAIDLGRKLGYRLIVRPKKGEKFASSEEVFGADALTIVDIQFEEVTNHYEQ
jgi:proteic killer suppression protein